MSVVTCAAAIAIASADYTRKRKVIKMCEYCNKSNDVIEAIKIAAKYNLETKCKFCGAPIR